MKWLLVIALAACERGPSAPACGDAFTTFRTRLVASVHSDLERDVANHFIELALQRCSEDDYGGGARTCIANAATYSDYDGCAKLLTETQRKNLNEPNR